LHLEFYIHAPLSLPLCPKNKKNPDFKADLIHASLYISSLYVFDLQNVNKKLIYIICFAGLKQVFDFVWYTTTVLLWNLRLIRTKKNVNKQLAGFKKCKQTADIYKNHWNNWIVKPLLQTCYYNNNMNSLLPNTHAISTSLFPITFSEWGVLNFLTPQTQFLLNPCRARFYL